MTSWFYLTFVQNTGTAFGLFQGNNRALLLLAFIILAVLLYGARGLTERGGFWGALGVALVLGGAFGNIMDRMHYGQVIDFLDFKVWPVFNIADSAISRGNALPYDRACCVKSLRRKCAECFPSCFHIGPLTIRTYGSDDRDGFFGLSAAGAGSRLASAASARHSFWTWSPFSSSAVS